MASRGACQTRNFMENEKKNRAEITAGMHAHFTVKAMKSVEDNCMRTINKYLSGWIEIWLAITQ